MNCLEKYRAGLVRDINRNLRGILQAPQQEAVHDFRVGVKRLGALYFLLNRIRPELDARRILKPYRKLFKSSGGIRDRQIAMNLLRDLASGTAQAQPFLRALSGDVRRQHRRLCQTLDKLPGPSIRTPSIRGCGIAETAILRRKPAVLDELRLEILTHKPRMRVSDWHRKRILLKRYHHIMDAFRYCPGHVIDEREIGKIRMLEQLLGDWHDRVVTLGLIREHASIDGRAAGLIAELERQDRALLAASRIYLDKFERWHRNG